MTNLLARAQMAISLGVYIIFAAIGIAVLFFMAISHWKWRETREPVYFDITKGGPSRLRLQPSRELTLEQLEKKSDLIAA